MIWARLLIFGIPLAAAGLTWWSATKAQAGRVERRGEIIAMLPGPPPVFNPFMPATEIDREIVDLVYEPLIRIGPDGKLRPGLAERWDWDQAITCWFASEEKAERAAELLKGISADKWIEWGLDSVTAKGTEVVMRFSNPEGTGSQSVLEAVADLEPLPIEIIRIELDEPARPFHEHFMANSVEAVQIKRVWFDGDKSYELVVSGDPPRFIQELTEYYQPKPNLRAQIGTMDRFSALQEPSIDFVLRRNAAWPDGSPVTPEDVRVSVEFVLSQPWAVPNRETFVQIQGMEAAGAGRLRVNYRKRFGPAICGWAGFPILPATWLRAQQETAPESIFANAVAPGAGSFAVANRDAKSVILKPVSDTAPRLRVKQLAFYDGASVLRTRMGFATGALDMFWPDNQVIGSLLKDPELGIRNTPPRSRLLVLWNTQSPVLSDMRVREALALATDRQALIDDLLDGRGRVHEGLFRPGLWFAQNPAPVSYDPTAAGTQLNAAGFLKDVEGVAKRPNQKLTFELLTTAGNPQREKLAELLAAQWKKIGAQVTVTALPWSELLENRLSTHRFDAVILGLDFETSWDQFPFWHSSQAEAGGLNFCGIQDRQIDLLLEDLRLEFDPERVPAMAKELEDRVLALHPMLPLFTDMTQVAVRMSVLREGAGREEPSPWTLRDLVFDPELPPQTNMDLKMHLPTE